MVDEHANRAAELYLECCRLLPHERSPFLDRQCATDSDLRREVEELFGADDPSDPSDPAEPATGDWQHDGAEPRHISVGRSGVPERIGQYRLKRVLGSGGMGTVYLAVQENTGSVVALKMMRAGVASPSALQRFRHEAHILGKLRHASIARIFDAGTFNTGEGAEPFFAMEYVKGEDLDTFANREHLGTRQRLALLGKICDGLQHAHQRGIIHRDLKPANILVDDTGTPKILDFGVARASDSDMYATRSQTDVDQLIGTIPYMSPEQAAGDPEELDVRSDVYALGVVAYELLAGRMPYDVHQKAIFEALRMIREDEPTPLSSVNKVFRGDVETIIGKALEKNKARRYQSVTDLASDIRHYLDDEPIVARPQSVSYQLSKFVKRNKILVGSAAVVILALVGGVTATSAASARALAAERVAKALVITEQRATQRAEKATALANDRLASEQRATEAAALAAAEATEEAAIASAARGFLVDALHSVSPKSRGPGVTVRSVLDHGEPLIDERFADHVQIRIELHETYGQLFRELNQYEKAAEHFRIALDEATVHLPSGHPRRARALQSMGVGMLDLGRDDEAGRYFTQARAARRDAPAADLPPLAGLEVAWAFLLHDLGDYDQAEFTYRKAIRLHETADPAGLGAAQCMDFLARLAVDRGDLDRAGELIDTAMTIKQQRTDDPSTDIAFAWLTVGYVHHASQRWAEAIEAYRQSRDMYRGLYGGDEAFMVQLAWMDLVGVIEDATALGLAIDLSDQERQRLDAATDPLFAQAAMSLRNRGRILYRLGAIELGDDRFRRSLQVDAAMKGASRDESMAHTRRVWAALLAENGQMDAARSLLEQVLETQRRHLRGAVLAAVAPTLIQLGRLELAMDRAGPVCDRFDEAVRLRREQLGEGAWPTAIAMVEQARCLRASGERAPARAAFDQAINSMSRGLGDDDPRTIEARRQWADLDEPQVDNGNDN